MKKFLPFLIILIAGIAIWSPIFKIFYLQDEWQGLGHIFAEGVRHPIAGATTLQLIFGENRSLARLFGLFLFGAFPLNSLPVAIFSLAFHLINTWLVFVLAKKTVKNNFFAYFAAFAFMISSVSANAVYWYSASVGTLPATTLILSALFIYFDYLKTKDKRKISLSFALIFISLFFKEIGTFLFLLLPLYGWITERKYTLTSLKKYWVFLLVFFLLISFRVLQLRSIQGPKALFLTGSSQNFIETLLVRSVYYPGTSLSLEYFPAPFLLNAARKLTANYYPFIRGNDFELVAQTTVLDSIAFVLSIGIASLFFIFVKKESKESRSKLYFWFIFVLSSFLPYIIISKNYSYLESRYYYLALTGAVILMAWFLEKLAGMGNKLLRAFAFLVIGFYLFGHIKYLWTDLLQQVLISTERQNFIAQLSNEFRSNGNKRNIIYVTSDADYYAIGNKIPFQEGAGYTIMIILRNKILIPNKLLTNHFLWDIGTQGYEPVEDYGFGYFWNLDELRKAVTSNKISQDSLQAFSYDSKEKSLTNITGKVVKEIYRK